MCDDIYMYKQRCSELESELAQAQKTIAKLNVRLYDIKMAVKSRTIQDTSGVLDTIAWITYGWKD
jgi:prefoldin subunit 5